MTGFDDHVTIMGDWIPSPPSYFSSMIDDDAVAQSFANSTGETKSGPFLPGPQGQGASRNADQNDLPQKTSLGGDEPSNSNAVGEPKMSFRGGLVERIAARAGFNAPRLNTESIRPSDLSKNPEGSSSYFTIPPGLSPTTLLDSPVFLTNSMVQPSPTTGKFSFAPTGNNQSSTLMTDASDKGKEKIFEDASSFAFKPIAESGSLPFFDGPNKVYATGVGFSVRSDTTFLHQNVEPSNIQTFSNAHAEKNRDSNLMSEEIYNPVTVEENSPPHDEPNDDDGEQRSCGDTNCGAGQPEDGYNWRKYGQKQVKGSEHPRSYYKCTHPNCPVKKKVERSHEGHVKEIIYKGGHNHPKPPPNRRSALGPTNAINDMQHETEQYGTGANGDLIWSSMQKGNAAGGAPDWRQDNHETTTTAQLVQECNNGTNLQSQNGAQFETVDGVDRSPTFSNEEDDDDRVTHGSVSFAYDAEGDESESSKRRRMETYASEISGATRAIREPRVVVQTTSEVDILDDGYRWRKYGQKVVKGNPNPRSYYKCTSAGCNVRKHVERASHDLKSVITTYEGKHNHDVPAARNSSHVNNGGPQQAPPAPPPSSHIHRPEPPQIHSRFERPTMSSFSLPCLPPPPQPGRGHPGFAFGMNQPGLAGLGLSGLGHNHGKLPVMSVHPYLGGHQPRPMNEMGFMLPKAEPKMEPMTDSGFNAADVSSVYQQLMSRLPLGPQM